MFLFTYLPQLAVLAFTSGPLAVISTTLLVLSESSTIVTVLSKTFLIEDALIDTFDGVSSVQATSKSSFADCWFLASDPCLEEYDRYRFRRTSDQIRQQLDGEARQARQEALRKVHTQGTHSLPNVPSSQLYPSRRKRNICHITRYSEQSCYS